MGKFPMPASLMSGWEIAEPAGIAGSLTADEVHAWLFDLEVPPRPAQMLSNYLSHDERERAARFHLAHHRRRFESAHGLMRWLLAHYAGVEPAALQFAAGPSGKPGLAAPAASSDLVFNLSHSGGRAMLGVARGMAIGVDIEVMRAVPESDAIARSMFAAPEVQALQALDPARRDDGFFACWTRKEAYVKAQGGGLSVPLDGFEVGVDPDAPAALYSIAGSTQAAARWTLWGDRVAGDAWFAVAVDRRPATLRRVIPS
jgi:4'-phosphopantetheinyl transferase